MAPSLYSSVSLVWLKRHLPIGNLYISRYHSSKRTICKQVLPMPQAGQEVHHQRWLFFSPELEPFLQHHNQVVNRHGFSQTFLMSRYVVTSSTLTGAALEEEYSTHAWTIRCAFLSESCNFNVHCWFVRNHVFIVRLASN